jgi:hypothetical protein
MTSDDIIERLGGTAAVAKLCECNPQAVSQWKGLDSNGVQRTIPKARELHLRAIRPDAFVDRRKSRKAR